MSLSDSRHATILSVSSDIGLALARHWMENDYSVSGTYRSRSPELDQLVALGLHAVPMELKDEQSVLSAARALGEIPWSRLVLAAGSQEPVGLFDTLDAVDWSDSLFVNFVRQFQFLNLMLPSRARQGGSHASVLSFAGGATNRATTHYSAYTISKIASIKMTELLAAEIEDVSFTILGPGWVKTKIHNATLQAGEAAGDNYRTTLRHLEDDDFFPMGEVIEAVDWLMSAPIPAVSGRNFSAVHDPLGDADLLKALISDEDLYKLRRSGNGRLARP
jgi:NAD(P)-dependent dehydrogenase (short-subunit alcohol dehydrogenase family)